jgi:hypothetical protein
MLVLVVVTSVLGPVLTEVFGKRMVIAEADALAKKSADVKRHALVVIPNGVPHLLD